MIVGKLVIVRQHFQQPLVDAAPVMLGIGNLLAVILDFIIVAFAMFLLVKAMNKLAALKKKDEEPAPEEPAGPTTEELLAEIRDLLKEQK